MLALISVIQLALLQHAGHAAPRVALGRAPLISGMTIERDTPPVAADVPVVPWRELRARNMLDIATDMCRGNVKRERVVHDGAEHYALLTTRETVRVGRAAQWHRAKVAAYFGVWYFLSAAYSVANKRATNLADLPWCVSAVQLIVGSVFVMLLWATGAREPPQLTRDGLASFAPIGAFHAAGHVSGVVACAAGAVSFVQVVKSAGPVYACVLSSLVLRQRVSRNVWLSLLPIIGGVGLATVKELSFAWAALIGAVVSDLTLALRNVYSKLSMDGKGSAKQPKLSPANTFGIVTCLSALVCAPLAAAVEGRHALAVLRAAAPTRSAALSLAWLNVVAGLYFYLYTEVSMRALANVSPVTQAVGNTMRRVVIMAVCIVAFRTPVTPLGAVGSALAIGGSYAYAMIRTIETQQEAAAKAAEEEAAD